MLVNYQENYAEMHGQQNIKTTRFCVLHPHGRCLYISQCQLHYSLQYLRVEIVFKHFDPVTQKTHRPSITKADYLKVFREVIPVLFSSRMKSINTLCGQDAVLQSYSK